MEPGFKETPEQQRAREEREKQRHRESGGSNYREKERSAQEDLARRIEESKRKHGQNRED